MELHQPSYKHLLEIFEKFNRGAKPKNDRKQCQTGIHAQGGRSSLKIKTGPRRALRFPTAKRPPFSLPGPPREMVPMFDNLVIPYLSRDSKKVLVSRNVNIYGIGESAVEDMLHDYMLSMKNPTIAPYAKTGGNVSAGNRECGKCG